MDWIRFTLLYRSLAADAEAQGIEPTEQLADRAATCWRCPHTDGFGCAEFGCTSNEAVRREWVAILLNPEAHCPVLGESAW